MHVEGGQVALYHRHCQRIIRDASRMGIPVNDHIIATAIAKEARQLGNGVLKLLVSAGEGGRGYARPQEVKPQLHFTYADYPSSYAAQQREGISLSCASIKLSVQPALAGIKHLNRLEQVLIKRELPQLQTDDALVLDANDFIAEVSAANIFWYQNSTWFTPELSQCGVHGVMRQFLIDWLTRNSQSIVSGDFTLEDIAAADSVLVCNALMPLLPVKSLTLGDDVINFSLTASAELFNSIQTTYREEYAPAY